MASYRYERDIDPRELAPRKERQYTRKEKWANWWDYNLKWVILIGIAVAFVAYNFIGQYFFVPKPDYNIAVVAPYYLPDDTVTALQTALARYGEDRNGDGKVLVTLNVYTLDYSGEDPQTESAAYLTMAGTTKLATDVQGGLSSIFSPLRPRRVRGQHRHPAVSGRQPARPGQRQRLVEHGVQVDGLPRAGRAGPGRVPGRHHPRPGRRQPAVPLRFLHRDAGCLEHRHGGEPRRRRGALAGVDRRGCLHPEGGLSHAVPSHPPGHGGTLRRAGKARARGPRHPRPAQSFGSRQSLRAVLRHGPQAGRSAQMNHKSLSFCRVRGFSFIILFALFPPRLKNYPL